MNDVNRDLCRALGIAYTEKVDNIINRYFRVSRAIGEISDLQDFNKMLLEFCEINDIQPEKIYFKNRFEDVVTLRKELAYLLAQIGYKPHLISKLIKVDRTTIYHYLDTIKDRFSIDHKYKRKFYSKYFAKFTLGVDFDNIKEEELAHHKRIVTAYEIRKREAKRIRDIEAMPSL